jgi:hypothetical protein
MLPSPVLISRLLYLALCLLMPLTAPAHDMYGVPVTSGPNLLPDGNFTAADLATHWSWDNNQGGMKIAKAAGRDGGHSVELTSSSTSYRGKFSTKPFQVTVGRDIRVSVWVKTREHLGGTFAVLEGKAARENQDFHIAGGSSDWTRYEFRTTVVPKEGSDGQQLPMTLWFYVYGTGTVWLDSVEICEIQPDVAAQHQRDQTRASQLAAQIENWAPPKPARPAPGAGRAAVLQAAAQAVTDSSDWGLLATDGLLRVFRDKPFYGPVANAVQLEMVRHEYEGAQVLVFAYGGDLTGVDVGVEGLDGLQVQVLPVAYGDRSQAPPLRWYEGEDIGQSSVHWPDALLNNRSFSVQADTVQPVYLRVYAPADTRPGAYHGTLKVRSAKGNASMALQVRVHAATLPTALKLKAMTVSGPKDQASIDLALEQRLGIGDAFAAMTWNNPTFKPKGDSFDFSEVEKRLQYSIDRGLNAFIMASTPKSGRFGFPDQYSAEWKAKMSKVLREYGAWLEEKGWLSMAYYNNIDEPWDTRHEQVKDLYAMAKKANPDVNAFICLNKIGDVEALKNHSDTFDIYIQQHYQQQTPALMKQGKEVWWAICIWPDERPNVFIENPLIDGRIIGWMAFKYDVAGFEYWALASYDDDWEKRGKAPGDGSWITTPGGVLTTAWPYDRMRAGDGYLVYPGDGGQPLNSLRFEALRDGLEDHHLLVMLQEKLPSLGEQDRAEARKLLDGGDGLVTNAHLFSSDAERLLLARQRVLALLSR